VTGGRSPWPGRLRRASILAVLVGALALLTGAERRRIQRPVAPLVPGAARHLDAAALMADVRALSAPQMEGRRTGTPGGARARAYIVERLRALGIEPVFPGYLEPFRFRHTSVRALWRRDRPVRLWFDGTNVIGAVAGTDPSAPAIVLSAHYDHLGIRKGTLYPGADDNASGVAAVLAIAADLRGQRPRHRVVIALFDAEEQGLRGSKAFVAELPTLRLEVAADLNLDMVSRNARREVFVCGAWRTPSLRPLVEEAARQSRVKVLLGHDRPMARAGLVEDWTDESDQGSFHDKGIPFLYVGVEDHPDYHQPTDTADRIDPAFFAGVGDSVLAILRGLDRDLDQLVPAR
jgi:Peptidase family M28